MNKFTEVMSPVSWLILHFAGWIGYFVVLKPSWFEFGLVFLVDIACLLVISLVGERLFCRSFPIAGSFLYGLDVKAASSLPTNEKISLIQGLIEFPARRAKFVTTLTNIKILPSMIIMLLVWRYEGPAYVQFLKIFLSHAVITLYFYATTFLDNTLLASQTISNIHEQSPFEDVSNAFIRNNDDADFSISSYISIGVMWAFVLALQSVVFWSGRSLEQSQLFVALTTISFLGLLLGTRIWYLSHRVFMGGLNRIFSAFSTLDFTRETKYLPVHPSSILSQFSLTFNELVTKLMRSDREISQLVFMQAQENRFQSIGEISALIAHDLSAPLHVVSFCTEQLKENPRLISNPEYLSQLELNTQRAIELVTTIRSYLKGDDFLQKDANVGTSIRYALRLARSAFHERGAHRVQFNVDTELDRTHVSLSSSELTQIFLNLISNSIKALFDSNVAHPSISILLKENSTGELSIIVTDNGPGMSEQHFSEILNGSHDPYRRNGKPSLGLKLVSRLLERNGGGIALHPSRVESGAAFLLRLRQDHSET